MNIDLRGQEPLFDLWRRRLGVTLTKINALRHHQKHFNIKLYCFFVLINAISYQWAMGLVFPHMAFGYDRGHYFMILFPVALLGAVFDYLSFFVTLYLIKSALKRLSHLSFIAHLACDAVIAVLATGWVVFVFIFSGWLINSIQGKHYQQKKDGTFSVVVKQQRDGQIINSSRAPDHFEQRSAVYQKRLMDAVHRPSQNWKNITFGAIIGLSAMLPTFAHIVMFLLSIPSGLSQKKGQVLLWAGLLPLTLLMITSLAKNLSLHLENVEINSLLAMVAFITLCTHITLWRPLKKAQGHEVTIFAVMQRAALSICLWPCLYGLALSSLFFKLPLRGYLPFQFTILGCACITVIFLALNKERHSIKKSSAHLGQP